MKKLCTITILPIDKQLQAYEGDSLYTLLLVEGLIMPDDPNGAKLRLEKGSLSPAEHPEAEEAAFSPSEQAEDWILASERYITGDAVLSMGVPQKLDLGDQQPLTDHGYALAVDLGTGTICIDGKSVYKWVCRAFLVFGAKCVMPDYFHTVRQKDQGGNAGRHHLIRIYARQIPV